MSSSRVLFSEQLFSQGGVWLPGWICLMEMVPSASDFSHWQWLGQAPVTPANVQSIASISSGTHKEQNPRGVCLHLLLSSYRTNAWELLGTYYLSAYDRTSALSFCMLTAVPCLFRYVYYARSKANFTWHFLCLTDRILGSVPCMFIFNHTFISQVCEDIKSFASILRPWWSGICSAVIDIYCINGVVIGLFNVRVCCVYLTEE